MNDMSKVKSILNLGDNFHMCDVSSVSEKGIHLESWNEDVSSDELEQIALLIVEDDFDIAEFELLEIPHPKVFCFGNPNKNQYFDVVKFFDNKWQFSYMTISENGLTNQLAHSIEEAVNKYTYE